MNKLGFTLTELIIITVIIGILVSIAIPTYIDTMEKTRGKEAITTLQTMFGAERTYGAERRIYINLTTGSTDSAWQAIGIDNPNLNNQRAFNYSLTTTSSGAVYTAVATRRSGLYSSSFIRINYTGSMDFSNWPFPQ